MGNFWGWIIIGKFWQLRTSSGVQRQQYWSQRSSCLRSTTALLHCEVYCVYIVRTQILETTPSWGKSWYRQYSGTDVVILTTSTDILSRTWYAPEQLRAEKARAMVTPGVQWSVNKVIAGSSMVLSTFASPLNVLLLTDRQFSAMLSHCNHGFSRRQEVCIVILLYFIVRIFACCDLNYKSHFLLS